MLTRSLLSLLFSLTLGLTSFEQANIDWAKYDKLPFRKDTSLGFVSRRINKEFCAIPDITKSEAIFELRVTSGHMGFLGLNYLSYYKDSIVLNSFSGEPDTSIVRVMIEYRDSSAEIYSKVMAPLLEKCGGYAWQVKRKYILSSEADKILNELLVKQKLFSINLKDEISILEKRLGVENIISDTNSSGKFYQRRNSRFGVTFEVKYRNQFRCFQTSFIVYDEKGEFLTEVARIQFGSELLRYFATLSNNK